MWRRRTEQGPEGMFDICESTPVLYVSIIQRPCMICGLFHDVSLLAMVSGFYAKLKPVFKVLAISEQ